MGEFHLNLGISHINCEVGPSSIVKNEDGTFSETTPIMQITGSSLTQMNDARTKGAVLVHGLNNIENLITEILILLCEPNRICRSNFNPKKNRLCEMIQNGSLPLSLPFDGFETKLTELQRTRNVFAHGTYKFDESIEKVICEDSSNHQIVISDDFWIKVEGDYTTVVGELKKMKTSCL